MKRQHATTHRLPTIILALGILLAITSLLLSSYTLMQLRESTNDTLRIEENTTARLYQLSFCQDRGISPCDEPSLSTWNEAHPEDPFNFAAFRRFLR